MGEESMDPALCAGRIADKQLGLITTAQALTCGLTHDRLKQRVRAGLLVRLHLGVYRTAGAVESDEHRALAACLACGPTAVASHRTAARLWGLADDAVEACDVTIDPSVSGRVAGVSVHRSALNASDRTRRGPIPLTTVRRTLLDLAGCVPVEDLEEAADRAFRDKLTTPERLLVYLGDRRFLRFPGSGTLRAIASDRSGDGVPESILETKMISLLRRYGLPDPVRQHEIVVRARKVRFDLAYPDAKIAIELDGRGPHWGRRRWQDDHDRHNATELAGWPTLRFTWSDVTDRPSYVAFTVADALGLVPVRWKPSR